MPNPLFKQIGQNQLMNDNGISQFINQVKEFQKNFNGNPRDEVQKLLNSGKMSQAQFNQYAQIANQISELMK